MRSSKFIFILRKILFFLGFYPFHKISKPNVLTYFNTNSSIDDFSAEFFTRLLELFESINQGNGRHKNQIVRHANGLSGQKFRILLTELRKSGFADSYLEVGTYTGSTLLSIACEPSRNIKLELSSNVLKPSCVVAVDNWVKNGSSSKILYNKLSKLPENCLKDLSIVSSDMYELQLNEFASSIDLFFYDGPHSASDQFHGVLMADKYLKNIGIFIVDDWNVDRIKRSTMLGLSQINREVVGIIEVQSSINDFRDVEAQFGHWGRGFALILLKTR